MFQWDLCNYVTEDAVLINCRGSMLTKEAGLSLTDEERTYKDKLRQRYWEKAILLCLVLDCSDVLTGLNVLLKLRLNTRLLSALLCISLIQNGKWPAFQHVRGQTHQYGP